jgi:Ca-activated chloride channel family protein
MPPASPFRRASLCLFLLCCAANADTQQPAATGRYVIPFSVNEVDLPFTVTDWDGRPINDIQVGDVRLRDNNQLPEKILKFTQRTNLPFRVGLLIDTSPSVRGTGAELAETFTDHILDKSTDQAFVMPFDSDPKVTQPWTGDATAIDKAIKNRGGRMRGTAIYDALYIACRDMFSQANVQQHETSNFILLFTDGLDNASHVYAKETVSMCQQKNTVIFVFSSYDRNLFQKEDAPMRTLVAENNGRIFYESKDEDPDKRKDAMWHDLEFIEQSMRNNYLLIYTPAHFKSDGSFHHIKLDCPKRGGLVSVRKGYYARGTE